METTVETAGDLRSILDRISFVNTSLDFKWQFEFLTVYVDADRGPARLAWHVWVSFERPDTITGKIGRGFGRQEIIWKGATLSSVVKTAWLLVELMVRHELMEGFRFDGVRPFNPHNSITDLCNLQKTISVTTFPIPENIQNSITRNLELGKAERNE